MKQIKLLDCTLRDGGYYNNWDFSPSLVSDYLEAMKAAEIDVVEIGFRFLSNDSFMGACAFTSDDFLSTLDIPEELVIGVMLNGSDLCTELGSIGALQKLFPLHASQTRVDLVRIACHFHELDEVFPATDWLVERGYRVGINLMQITDRSRSEIGELTRMARSWPIEVLYIADSLGGMTPEDTAEIVGWLQEGWDGPIGIHTHDNMGRALANTLRAQIEGATWLDSTVTGMGRGAGNARTEELVIEAQDFSSRSINIVPLMKLIRNNFNPLKTHHGWGTNPYYYLAGKYGLHPTYIQEMLGDVRYGEEDILAVIDYLHTAGGKSFKHSVLAGARDSNYAVSQGSWAPSSLIQGREIFIIGTGPSVQKHRSAVESYIRRANPVVMVLNTQEAIDQTLIDIRVACHPVRILADAVAHARQNQPLVVPVSNLPENLVSELAGKKLLDFGMYVKPGLFEFNETNCITPSPIVLAYALGVASSGKASKILLAGFDGYDDGDARNDEVEQIFGSFSNTSGSQQVVSLTPSRYKGIEVKSVYGV